jgi:putative transposase
MPTIVLACNTPILIGDRKAVFRRYLPKIKQLQIEFEDTGELRNVPGEVLADMIANGEARIPMVASDQDLAKEVEARIARDMHALPETIKQRMLRSAAYIDGLTLNGHLVSGHSAIREAVSTVAQQRGETPPSLPTVYRWMKLWTAAYGDVRALAPADERRGNRLRRLPPPVIAIIEQAFNERYLTEERPSLASVHATVLKRVDDYNAVRPPHEQVRRPGSKTIRRELQRRDRYEVMAARYGKRAADLEFGVFGRGPQTTRILERVECDSTKLDIFVVDDARRLPLGRPWFTLLIDHYSRMPLGYYLGWEPPSAASLMLALRHAILPKTWMKQRHPEITGEWPCYGIPEALVVDNGREYHSKHLELAARQLGIEIQHTKVKTPWHKGAVERFFGEVNRKALGAAHGKAFASIIERGDYDPKKNAVMTLTTLEKAICKWIVDVHGASVHSGITDVPLARWNENAEDAFRRLPANQDDLNVLISLMDRRVASRIGIELHYLHFNSEELSQLRSRLPKRRTPTKLDIKIDPTDLAQIHVRDPATLRYFSVPCVDQDYARGLGLWQHKVIVRHARRIAHGKVDQATLVQAKEDIHRMITEAMGSVRKIGPRIKAARFLESGGQPGGLGAGPQPPPSPPPIRPIPIDLGFDEDDGDWSVEFDRRGKPGEPPTQPTAG